ncbi:Demethylmenaquinone methyltransferase [Pelomyxa schiedti]|nr:Demethylmenaquinone methyltransferase [Pelomyxa schiedti]
MTYYDSIARGYERLHKEEQLKKIAVITQHPFGAVSPTDKLLDVGCGPCFCAWPCVATGIDPSAELLKFAAKNAPSMRVILSRAEDIGDHFAENEFDVVVSLTAIQNFDDLDKGLSEMVRVCKGRFCLTFLKASSKAPRIEAIINSLIHVTDRIEEEKDIIIFGTKNP